MARCALRATSRSSIRRRKPLVWRDALLWPSAAADIRQTSPFATAPTRPPALPMKLWRAIFLRRSQRCNGRTIAWQASLEASSRLRIAADLPANAFRRSVSWRSAFSQCDTPCPNQGVIYRSLLPSHHPMLFLSPFFSWTYCGEFAIQEWHAVCFSILLVPYLASIGGSCGGIGRNTSEFVPASPCFAGNRKRGGVCAAACPGGLVTPTELCRVAPGLFLFGHCRLLPVLLLCGKRHGEVSQIGRAHV